MATPKAAGRTRVDAEESAREALARARQHLQTALKEALEAVRALLDAGNLLANGQPADAHPTLAKLSKGLDDLSTQLGSDASPTSAPVFDTVLDALDIEIERWEKRSESDAEARPVLRAFIGVREILWEFGLRRDKGSARATRPRSARVQRVDVQG